MPEYRYRYYSASELWSRLEGSLEEGAGAMDSIFRFLNKVLPLSLQHVFRDSGGFRQLHDCGAVALACGLILIKPTLLLLHWRIGKSRRTYYYGISCCEHKQIELYDTLCSSKEERASLANSGGEGRLLVFVHGGAWGSGRLWMYRVIANNISRCFCCSRFALIRYPVYTMTDGSIIQQALAVGSAVDKARSVGDAEAPREVVLCGHSSGANVASLSVVKNFCSVSALLSLAGVFDVYKHFLWESSRGVMEVSPMKAAAGDIEGMASCSPALLARCMQRAGTHFLLYHGLLDHTVPCAQTREFREALLDGGARVSAVYRPVGHAAPVADFLFYDRETASRGAVAELFRHYCAGRA